MTFKISNRVRELGAVDVPNQTPVSRLAPLEGVAPSTPTTDLATLCAALLASLDRGEFVGDVEREARALCTAVEKLLTDGPVAALNWATISECDLIIKQQAELIASLKRQLAEAKLAWQADRETYVRHAHELRDRVYAAETSINHHEDEQ